jgi:hypothetical protein
VDPVGVSPRELVNPQIAKTTACHE